MKKLYLLIRVASYYVTGTWDRVQDWERVGEWGEGSEAIQTLTTVCTQINDSISMKKLAAHFNAQRALMSNGH